MGKKLQSSVLLGVIAFLMLWLFNDVEEAFGQIQLTSGEPFTVAFYEGSQAPAGQQLNFFPVSGFQSIISEDLRPAAESTDTMHNYMQGAGGAAYPGKTNLINVPGASFSGFSVRNQSENDFSEMGFVFDFISVGGGDIQNQHIRLVYRKNRGNWADVPGGRLNLSAFQTGEESPSVSLQLMMNDLYISSNDIIDFAWISEYDLPDDFPVYLQQFEMLPVVFNPASLNRGDIIITEIMPKSTIDGYSLEYIEIYNPFDKPVSLKGMQIATEAGVVVIDKEFVLPAWQIGIIANADLSEFEQIQYSYFYDGKILPEENGRITLSFGGQQVASVTYEAPESNKSFELQEARLAFDGYTSLQNLEISARNFFGQLAGSPGEFGRTLPMFKKEYTRPGVYLLSVPGKLVDTNRLQYRGLAFFTLSGEPISPLEIAPYEPVLMHKEQDDTTMLIADGINLTGDHADFFTSEHGNFRFIMPVNPAHRDFGGTLLMSPEILPPVLGEWNSRLEKIDIVTPASLRDVDGWAPLITSNFLNDSQNRYATNQIRQNEHHIWAFSLFEAEARNGVMIDEAAAGFSETGVYTNGMPKALVKHEIAGRQNHPLQLYISDAQANERANSFIQLAASLTEKKEIVIGIDKNGLNNQMQAELRWNWPDIIPEDWTVTLSDPATGTQIDMRQQNRYQFRIHPAEEETPQHVEERLRFRQLRPGQVSEFVITIAPPSFAEQNEEETEVPGSIELRQNYPNPFNPATNIVFYLPEERQVKIGIFNIVGQQVATLIEDNLQAGEHTIVWDASNNPSGIYIVQLESGRRTFTRKITLVK